MNLDKEQYAWLAEPDPLDMADELSHKLLDELCQNRHGMDCVTNGLMGVPITFLDKFCPEQFEIVGRDSPTVNGKMLYQRIFIRKRHNVV